MLLRVLSTVLIFQVSFTLMAFCSSTKFPTTLLRFRITCLIGDEDGGGCG